MADSDFSNPAPQFGTAEYAPKSGTDVCKSCNQGISGQYFRVNGSLACARCVDQLKNHIAWRLAAGPKIDILGPFAT